MEHLPHLLPPSECLAISCRGSRELIVPPTVSSTISTLELFVEQNDAELANFKLHPEEEASFAELAQLFNSPPFLLERPTKCPQLLLAPPATPSPCIPSVGNVSIEFTLGDDTWRTCLRNEAFNYANREGHFSNGGACAASPSTHPPGRLGSPCCLGNFPNSAAVDWIRSSAPGPRSRSSRTAGESGRSAVDPGIVFGGHLRGSSAVFAAATPTPSGAVRPDFGQHCGRRRQTKRRLTRAHQ